MNVIEFFFDFSSPYGYFASTRIEGLAARHGQRVEWRPYLVGTAMKATGHQPLYHTPMLHDYVVVDVPRFARLLDVPFTLPAAFPLVASAASRAFYWTEQEQPSLAKKFAAAVYQAFFAEGHDISREQTLAEIAENCGIDAQSMLTAVRRPDIKELFRQKNDDALAKGVFGSPFFLVNGEPFWGADRLDQVDKWLSTGGW